MSETQTLFLNAYQGKRVLVTGHTGFKGSWLALWLLSLGAKVAGYSKYLPSQPCHFDVINLKNKITHYEHDVRNIDQMRNVFEEFKPEIVFHLAAQPIVRFSYDEPKTTFDTNLGGTVNVLECLRTTKSVKAAVVITSDKCYENVEQQQGYHEEDRLGGADPYSASKACAEIAFSAYYRSFFKSSKDLPAIATTRAGNVIGGGDWAQDRIVPDCVRAWSKREEAVIRNPQATRPWQHVLEPLSGYLWLGVQLLNSRSSVEGEAYNFGPKKDVIKSVGELADLFVTHWTDHKWKHVAQKELKKEATLLTLSCEKALAKLKWEPILSFEETIELTAHWYQNFYAKSVDPYQYSLNQIKEYAQKGAEHNAIWTKG